EFNSRTSSFGPMVQTPTSLSDGNVVPQASSSSSLKPPGAGSSLKVSGQVLSRAALEISQAPTISLAASLGAAVCAPAPAVDSASAITARHARAGMGNPDAMAVARTLSRRARLVMPRPRAGGLTLHHLHMRNLRALMAVSVSAAATAFPRPGSAAAC